MSRKPTTTAPGPTDDETVERQAPDPSTGVVTTLRDTAVKVVRGQITTAGGRSFKVKQFVNLPMISLRVDGTEVIVRILSPIAKGSEIADGQRRGAIRRPADVMTVESVDGMQGMMVASFLIKEELEEKYPDAGYVGRWYWIKRTDTKQKPNGESYGLYAIAEIEAPDGVTIDQEDAAD